MVASANACPIIAAGSCDFAAGDVDIIAVFIVASANASSTVATDSCDLSAGNGDVTAISLVASANTCSVSTAGGDQFAVFIFVRDGQLAIIVLFQTSMPIATLKRICTIQLDVYIAL